MARRSDACEDESPEAMARRIENELSALTSFRADFPFALGHLVARIVDDRRRMSAAEERPWWDAGRNLITCILSHLVCSPHEVKPPHRLPALRSLLLKPEREVRAELGRIERESVSILAHVLALDLLAQAASGRFDLVRATAVIQTRWLFGTDRPGIDPAA